jgi:hypothetical protein
MLHVVAFFLLADFDGLDRPEISFVRNLEDVLEVPVPEILLRNVNLVLVLCHLVLDVENCVDLSGPAHHADQIAEEGLGSIKGKLVLGTATTSFILLWTAAL